MVEVPKQLHFGPGPPLQVRWRHSLPPPGPVYQRGENYPFTVHRPRRDRVFVRWPGLGDFLISGRGRRILVRPERGAPEGELRDLIVTTIASFALAERGVETLHASAVEIRGQAVAFAGTGGSGKSSLAAFFIGRGRRLLSDDVLALVRRRGRVLAYPALPEVKLDPGALIGLGLGPHLVRRFPNYSKRYWRVPLARGSRRLAVLYFPRRAASPRARTRLVPLSRAAAFRELLGHTFAASLRPRTRLRRQFELYAEMAESVPARRLIVPRGFNRLEEVAERIERDLAEILS